MQSTYVGFEVGGAHHEFFEVLSSLQHLLDVLRHDVLHLIHLRLERAQLVVSASLQSSR